MQMGFVIDHSRCIGCHACTIACKSENDVPLGSFRTWVKHTEQGEFPAVKRSFAVLRCNQCTDAPCVTICPVNALEKRKDGIVDVDPAACIGCKACMQGCPYDALYINDDTGTAEKCHFCAHRTEQGLAPACAVVCPTEAIIPGDFDDPGSVVSKMRAEHDLKGRKLEAGTGPNVLYREVAPAGIDPLKTSGVGGYQWADRIAGIQADVEAFQAAEQKAEARTTYNVDREPIWGWKVAAYLFTKSVAAGLLPVALWCLFQPGLKLAQTPMALAGMAALSMVALGVTSFLLIVDLKRPERFLFILLRPNWSSWLVKGSYVLMVYGALLSAWLAVGWFDVQLSTPVWYGLAGLTSIAGALAACYTAWLFAQAKGRVLWMQRGLALHLVAQAAVAGAAVLLCITHDPQFSGVARWALIGSLVLHAAMTAMKGKLSPLGREEEYSRTVRLITHGPFKVDHWVFGIGIGIVVPILLLLIPSGWLAWPAAGALALFGLWVEENTYVKAGQALPIS